MVGGLYFGPPAWSPDKIEGLTEGADAPLEAGEAAPTRAGLAALVERAGVGKTSAVLPGLGEQAKDLGDRKIRGLVLNLLPTQPEYALQTALSRVGMADLLAGLAALQKMIEAKRVAVVMDRHDWTIRRLWKRAARTRKYKVVRLLNKYPQAHHTVLLRTLYGKKVHPHELPTTANRVIVDAVACWGLGRYLRTRVAMTERPVQLYVRGTERRGDSRIVMGKVGESVESFLERARVSIVQREIIINGMMTGELMGPEGARIGADTEAISVRVRPETEEESACIACGWCLDHCPTALNPVGLFELARKTDATVLERASPARFTSARESLNCIGCGLCSYVCPTRLPLMQEILNLRDLATRKLAVEKSGSAQEENGGGT